jgi:Domain of unknown function (DUF5668)
MNCATHNNVPATAYCRTCGKALCANCTRSVHGVIYCESCLAARLEGVQPPPPPTSYQGVAGRATGGGGPNPALAGILAGIFPFGVGAVYNGQYAKGFAHLVIFVGCVWGLSEGNGDLAPVLGVGLAFFIVYQIIDAIRSAHAIQAGQPAPDPFGLGRAFGAGEGIDTSKVPTGAIVLIGLGVLFLLHTMGVWFFEIDRFWPIILIAIGAWLFARRAGLAGERRPPGGYRCQNLTGPAVLVTLGLLFLLQNAHVARFARTWPLLLVVIGLTRVLRGNGPSEPPPAATGELPTGPVSGEVQAPPSEVING